MPAKSLLHAVSLKYNMQSPGSRRRSAEGRKQKAEGGKQMLFILTPDS
jgi:hypothetical protein